MLFFLFNKTDKEVNKDYLLTQNKIRQEITSQESEQEFEAISHINVKQCIKIGVIAHTFNPSTVETEAGRSV